MEKDKAKILSTICPAKDPDGLGWAINGLSEIDLLDFIPATPKAVFVLLDHYKLWDMKGKSVAVLGQSNLVGKPLVMEAIKRWANVHSLNSTSDIETTKQFCKESDYIFACTGKVHLLNKDFIREDGTQILVDVWYGHKNGKPVGDMDREAIQDKVAAITPVPGGVGPLTVACIFENILDLQGHREVLKRYWKV